MPFLVFALGAIVGSFLNVCIFRLPENLSVVTPGSHCRTCKRPIAWFDNIPIFSFFILKGRCRHCRVALSWQYAAVEAFTGALFLLFYEVYGLTAVGGIFLVLSLALLVESVIDLRHQIIPDEITLPGIALGVLVSVLQPEIHGQTAWSAGLLWSFVGVLAGGGSLYLAGTVAEWILKKEAMGGGDVKLLAMIGAVIGWPGVLWTIFASSLLGSLVGLYLRWKTGEERIPFGPYLALGAFLYLFFGKITIEWYLRFLSGAL